MRQLFQIQRILTRYQQQDERSKAILRNIAISIGTKVANVIASLLIIPLTIDFLNPQINGIWMTISVVVGWMVFFNLGLSNGLRNRFAEAKSRGDIALARAYVSTTYFAITLIIIGVFGCFIVFNNLANWSVLLHIDALYEEELHHVFTILGAFTCLNIVASIFGSIVSADQKPGIESIIICVGQYISLLVIFLLTRFAESSLTTLSLYYSGIPALTMLGASFLFFRFSRYKVYSPSIRTIRVSLIKDLLSLGAQFFIIYLCLIAIFQITNLIIIREINEISVTQYNVVNRYFNIVYMVAVIVITPFWSAFTDAYTQKDFDWMKRMIRKLELYGILSSIAGFGLLILSPWAYQFWLQGRIDIPFSLSVAMFFLIICQIFGQIYMNLLNGIGTIRMQLLIYVVCAILAWPLFTWSCHLWGLNGVVLVPAFVSLLQGLSGRYQLFLLMKGTATGIWNK